MTLPAPYKLVEDMTLDELRETVTGYQQWFKDHGTVLATHRIGDWHFSGDNDSPWDSGNT